MKKTLVVLLAAAMLLTFSACITATPSETTPGITPSSEEAQASTFTPVSLDVAYMPNYSSLWAVLTGIEMGYFEEQGITIHLYEFADGPTEIAAMESGSIDVSYIGPGAHRLCSTGNAYIFLMQQITDNDAVLGLKSHGVNSLNDLAGKNVAYASGTSSEAILKLALDSVSLTMDDIKAYDMDTSNMVAAMTSGSVDACATWSPNTLMILNELGDDVIKFCTNIDFIDRVVNPASWVCTPDYAANNPDILTRFIRAMYKAMDYGSQEANFEQIATWVAAQCGSDFETAYGQRDTGTWYNGSMVLDGIADGSIIGFYKMQQQAFFDSEAVDPTTALDVETFVLSDFMIQAGDIY